MPVKTYGNNKAYAGTRKQPLADMILKGPTSSFTVAGALVDTGADLVQIPHVAGVAAGFLNPLGGPLPSGASVIGVTTAGGGVNMIRLPSVAMDIEGQSVIVDVLFHPSGTSRPLIGRNAIWALKDVGFDTADWLWA